MADDTEVETESSEEEITKNESEHRPQNSVAGPEASGHDNYDEAKANEDKPSYSLAGPQAEENHKEEDGYNSDEGFGDYGRPEPAEYGLSKTLPKSRRGERWKKSHKRRRKLKSGNRSGNNQTNADGSAQDKTSTSNRQSTNEANDVQPNFWFGIRRRIREPLAEWLATMVLVLMGVSANLQYMTGEGSYGDYNLMTAMWGLAYMMAIHIAGGISGAHCSPVVSINFCVFRGFPARKAAIYIAAQIIGAICGCFIAFGVYHDAIMNYDPEMSLRSGKGFFTMPLNFASPTTAFFTDFTAAAVMSGTILAMGDAYNAPPTAGMHGFIMGLVGSAVTGCLGYNTGPPINPAKDIASRIVAIVIGYGATMWQGGWWAQAWFAAIAGGLFGCFIYDVAIYEGPESPVNYPRSKVILSAQGNKAKVLKTGILGLNKKRQAKRDLENGNVGINTRLAARELGGRSV